MPLNTRVGRCVTKLKGKYGYGKAIGICQHSTKQNYLTGKTMRKKKTSRRKNRSRKKRGGMRILRETPLSLTLKTHMGTKYMMKVDDNNQPVLNRNGMIDLYDYTMAANPPHRLLWKKSIPSYKNPQEGSGKKTSRRKNRSRKKRGGQHSPTWIIQMTPAALSKFKTTIYQNPKYISTTDEEAEEIINYFISYAETNSSINHWIMMTYNNGYWFPGQQPNYDKSLLECSRPCYKVDSTGIKPVLKRTSSRGGRKRKQCGASKPDHTIIDILPSSDEEQEDAHPPAEPQRVDVDGIHVGSHVRVKDGDSPNLDDFGEVLAINNDKSASIEVYLSYAENEEWFRPDQLELIREGGRKKQKKKRKTKKRGRNRKRRTKRKR